ncbi:hypothetical protein BDK89_0073 [Ilumatobacter fluminis]|uniref:Acetyltransferase (GNAT) family protein n=1 Tax=Ilumatobacter fluminis TaxID=467091 RepID=A0A4V3EIH3_9ACTN|nr:hypothetical protein [Ilumatobacter fluminis]TDT14518.1 hypothetical protein BDK89_0073 [Ilumatobacter fluminis]
MPIDEVSAGTPPESGTSAWYVREQPLRHGRWQVRCHLDDRHDDGTIVDDSGDLDDVFVLWRAELAADGHSTITVAPGMAPGAPGCWFVELPEGNADPPAMTLVAFGTDDHAPGTVVSDAEFFHLPVRSDQQLGAIRWWPEEAVVDQVFVHEDWRRRHVATVLIYTASAYHQHHGWPGRLHSDGRRTKLGISLVTGLRHPERIAPLDLVLPPMDRPT